MTDTKEKEKKGPETTSINIRGIGREEWKKFKIWCIKNDIEHNEGLNRIINTAIKD